MTKIYPHIIPEIEEWPIYKFSQKRDEFIASMNAYTYNKLLQNNKSTVEEILSSTIYKEKIRVRTNAWKVDPSNEIVYWKRLESELSESSQNPDKEQLQKDILKRVINRYSEEIVGNFNPGTFRFARKFLTAFFKRLLNTAAGRNHHRLWGNKHQLHDRLLAKGAIDELRKLMKIGTVVILPTHFSNLDSILVGYAIDSIVGIPAFSYGAGLNLYDVELVAYYMSRLGAYRVDRRKKNRIYLENLKTFANLSIQNNVNNIFFPGGTRSRSGELEVHIKLGLLSTLLKAQRELFENKVNRKVFVVPLILGYHFVLEAKDLIDQHLKRTGKEKYIKGKTQNTSKRKIMKFLWNLFSAQSEITLSFAPAMDVFGNRVDEEGNSYNDRNQIIDIVDYFKFEGKIIPDLQREHVYTKILGDRITESFHKYNIVLSSHLIAFSAFEYFLQIHMNRKMDLYSFLNLPLEDLEIPQDEFLTYVGKIQKVLQDLEKNDKVQLSEEISLSTDLLIEDGIKKLGIYHPAKPLIQLKNGNLGTMDLKVLYYYHNRLNGYNIIEQVQKQPVLTQTTS